MSIGMTGVELKVIGVEDLYDWAFSEQAVERAGHFKQKGITW